jgi:hypothetical protein
VRKQKSDTEQISFGENCDGGYEKAKQEACRETKRRNVEPAARHGLRFFEQLSNQAAALHTAKALRSTGTVKTPRWIGGGADIVLVAKGAEHVVSNLPVKNAICRSTNNEFAGFLNEVGAPEKYAAQHDGHCAMGVAYENGRKELALGKRHFRVDKVEGPLSVRQLKTLPCSELPPWVTLTRSKPRQERPRFVHSCHCTAIAGGPESAQGGHH